ncbi:MAG: hypothetical protein EOO42_01070 [Flavobacteriales bacterium]|nr:MAG: hypothetical protein EOO42_01070 [Flavobacteriales bacterium]
MPIETIFPFVVMVKKDDLKIHHVRTRSIYEKRASIDHVEFSDNDICTLFLFAPSENEAKNLAISRVKEIIEKVGWGNTLERYED